MDQKKVLSLEDRIPKIKEHRKRKANRRLIFLISLFFLLILLVIYFQSPLSNVSEIKVKGNESVPDQTIIKRSGLKSGDNIWNLDKKKAVQQLEDHQEVKHAKVKISFPNTVYLEIQEYKTIAYVLTGTEFHPILENGMIVGSNPKGGVPVNAPILSNFKEDAILENMAKELKALKPEIVNVISEIHYTPKKTDKYHITLFMNDGFEVSATILTFSEKMVHYPSIVSQLNPNVKGVIDMEVGSFFKAYETKETGGEGEQQEP
ncbi:FtsQ-type POTRA domain-containing protein [Bacillus sp. Sa1BUA2]|uniref:Cell division protein DivIB n=1 Tax=Bacillus norwichensis TaxID=2762217 RepID=A0ABR8VGN2_9BACI|nr:FtsQ-type POTRA domain-containing protein [Bacillus norwichensis]MBD8003940.1 FtsQ-type POTRA domain-containing protein [Bacillus norwichensis]